MILIRILTSLLIMVLLSGCTTIRDLKSPKSKEHYLEIISEVLTLLMDETADNYTNPEDHYKREYRVYDRISFLALSHGYCMNNQELNKICPGANFKSVQDTSEFKFTEFPFSFKYKDNFYFAPNIDPNGREGAFVFSPLIKCGGEEKDYIIFVSHQSFSEDILMIYHIKYNLWNKFSVRNICFLGVSN